MRSASPVRSTSFDKKLISYVQKSNELNRRTSEAKRLELKWNKLCDEEKRSQERNQKLLQDFEQVEQHGAILAAKTQKLKAAKRQYEDYINKMYPRWREELEHHRKNNIAKNRQYEDYINKMYPRWREELEHHRKNNIAKNGQSHSTPAPKSGNPLVEQMHSLPTNLPEPRWSDTTHRPPQSYPRDMHPGTSPSNGYENRFSSQDPRQVYSNAIPYRDEASQYGTQRYPESQTNFRGNIDEFGRGYPQYRSNVPHGYYDDRPASRQHLENGWHERSGRGVPYDGGHERLRHNAPNTVHDAHMLRTASDSRDYSYGRQHDGPTDAFYRNHERPPPRYYEAQGYGQRAESTAVHTNPVMLDQRSEGGRYSGPERRFEDREARQSGVISVERMPSAEYGKVEPHAMHKVPARLDEYPQAEQMVSNRPYVNGGRVEGLSSYNQNGGLPHAMHGAPITLDQGSERMDSPEAPELRNERSVDPRMKDSGATTEVLPSTAAPNGLGRQSVHSDGRLRDRGRAGYEDHTGVGRMRGVQDGGNDRSAVEDSHGSKITQVPSTTAEYVPAGEVNQLRASTNHHFQEVPEKPLEQADVSPSTELQKRSPRLYEAEKDKRQEGQANLLSDVKAISDKTEKGSSQNDEGKGSGKQVTDLQDRSDNLPLSVSDLKASPVIETVTRLDKEKGEERDSKGGAFDTSLCEKSSVEADESGTPHNESGNSEQSLGDFSDISLPDGDSKKQTLITSGRLDHSDKKADEKKPNEQPSHSDSAKNKPHEAAEVEKTSAEEVIEDIPEETADDLEELLAEGVSIQSKEVPSRKVDRVQGTASNLQRSSVRQEQENELKPDRQVSSPPGCDVSSEQQPRFTIDGFLILVQTVDADLEVSFSPETLYRSVRYSSDVREEIVTAVNRGDNLDSYDPSKLSMLVLDELPGLVQTPTSGCLIPDHVFSGATSFFKERKLRSALETSLVRLWKPLFAHFVNLVKNIILMADEVADLFGPLLISSHSVYRKESQALLRQILKDKLNDDGDDSEPESPPTSPRVSPTALDEPNREGNEKTSQSAMAGSTSKLSLSSESSDSSASVSPHNVITSEDRRTPDYTLSYENDSDEEQVPLTETAAYRRMMSSAQSEPVDDDVSDILGESLKSPKIESEADDDVERELARSISPPVTSPRQRLSPRPKTPEKKSGARQRPKLSLFGGDGGSLGVSYGSEDFGESWGTGEGGALSSSWKSEKSEKSEDISISEDSSLSPPLSPGYVPSAVEKEDNKRVAESKEERRPGTEKTTTKKKTDFWNKSDSESEVDLQLSNGGAIDSGDDDFDFYG